jgi:hypothetical protein
MTSLWHSPTLLEVLHDRAADSAAIVSGPCRMIYRMIKDPQAIRDFARTLLRSPASFPTISLDRQRHCQMARATVVAQAF